jgi:hypothetical protein
MCLKNYCDFRHFDRHFDEVLPYNPLFYIQLQHNFEILF